MSLYDELISATILDAMSAVVREPQPYCPARIKNLPGGELLWGATLKMIQLSRYEQASQGDALTSSIIELPQSYILGEDPASASPTMDQNTDFIRAYTIMKQIMDALCDVNFIRTHEFAGRGYAPSLVWEVIFYPPK